ncbi:MAG: hypothetical protein HUU49_02405 [Candidatus Buchananbacteria bacterium]|nr:hypothetical protein [Candidatus Buchananbacteria bacterium]
MIGIVLLAVLAAWLVLAVGLSMFAALRNGRECGRTVLLISGCFMPCMYALYLASPLTLGARLLTSLYQIPDVSWLTTAVLVLFFVCFTFVLRKVGLAFCQS